MNRPAGVRLSLACWRQGERTGLGIYKESKAKWYARLFSMARRPANFWSEVLGSFRIFLSKSIVAVAILARNLQRKWPMFHRQRVGTIRLHPHQQRFCVSRAALQRILTGGSERLWAFQTGGSECLKAQLRAPGNKPARGKVLFTYLSSLRMERVGRAGALVCLAARSNQRWSDPPPGRRKFNERMP